MSWIHDRTHRHYTVWLKHDGGAVQICEPRWIVKTPFFQYVAYPGSSGPVKITFEQFQHIVENPMTPEAVMAYIRRSHSIKEQHEG